MAVRTISDEDVESVRKEAMVAVNKTLKELLTSPP